MQRKPFSLLAALFSLTVIGLCCCDPIPQSSQYHDFADQRTFFGIPNFWNVASNLPFLFLGIAALWQSLERWNRRPAGVARWIPLVMGFGIFTAFFGSAYYHWSPDNQTLVWDRLPMTLMFMSLLALMMYDFLGERVGSISFFAALALGIFSVWYWQLTEAAGRGDLRCYAFVQFFPMLLVPFLFWLFPGKAGYGRYVALVLGWYVLAKLCEHFDNAIFSMLGFWSGHTIKHLLGGVSLFYVLKLMKNWRT